MLTIPARRRHLAGYNYALVLEWLNPIHILSWRVDGRHRRRAGEKAWEVAVEASLWVWEAADARWHAESLGSRRSRVMP